MAVPPPAALPPELLEDAARRTGRSVAELERLIAAHDLSPADLVPIDLIPTSDAA